jgi:hypothetical protein
MVTASCHLLIRLGQNASILGQPVHLTGDHLSPSLRLMILIDIHIIALSVSLMHSLLEHLYVFSTILNKQYLCSYSDSNHE